MEQTDASASEDCIVPEEGNVTSTVWLMDMVQICKVGHGTDQCAMQHLLDKSLPALQAKAPGRVGATCGASPQKP